MTVKYWYTDDLSNKYGPYQCDVSDFRQFIRSNMFKEEILICTVEFSDGKSFQYHFPVGWFKCSEN